MQISFWLLRSNHRANLFIKTQPLFRDGLLEGKYSRMMHSILLGIGKSCLVITKGYFIWHLMFAYGAKAPTNWSLFLTEYCAFIYTWEDGDSLRNSLGSQSKRQVLEVVHHSRLAMSTSTWLLGLCEKWLDFMLLTVEPLSTCCYS